MIATLRVLRGEEDLREDQRGGGRVDEEVVVFERRADPAAGGGLPRLVSSVGFVFCQGGHGYPPAVLLCGRRRPARRKGKRGVITVVRVGPARAAPRHAPCRRRRARAGPVRRRCCRRPRRALSPDSSGASARSPVLRRLSRQRRNVKYLFCDLRNPMLIGARDGSVSATGARRPPGAARRAGGRWHSRRSSTAPGRPSGDVERDRHRLGQRHAREAGHVDARDRELVDDRDAEAVADEADHGLGEARLDREPARQARRARTGGR